MEVKAVLCWSSKPDMRVRSSLLAQYILDKIKQTK